MERDLVLVCQDLGDLLDKVDKQDTRFVNIEDILAHEQHWSHCSNGSPWMTLVLDRDESNSPNLLQHVSSLLGLVVHLDTPYNVDTIGQIWKNPHEHNAVLLWEIVSDLEEGQSLMASWTVLLQPFLSWRTSILSRFLIALVACALRFSWYVVNMPSALQVC